MMRFKIYKELIKIGDIHKPLIALGFLKLWTLSFGLVPLLLYSQLVNKVLIEKQIQKLGLIVVGYLIVYLLITIGIAISKKFSNKLIFKFDIKIKHKLFEKYIDLDDTTYNKYGIGDLKRRIENDSVVACNFFTTHILEFCYSTVFSVILACILLFIEWRIALLGFVFVPLTFYVVNFIGTKRKKISEELWELQTKYESFLHSTLQNWKDIKINSLENMQLEELNKHFKKIRRISFKNQLYLHLALTYSNFQQSFITQLFIYFIGGLFVIHGYSQVGSLIVFINYFGQFYGFINIICNLIIDLKNDSVNIEKIIEILNLQIDKKPFVKIIESDIKVKNLSYKYAENDMLVLDDVSFVIKSGEHGVVVGESGSGKSTLVKLLTGQITPQNGFVFIGGMNINNIARKSIAEKVSVVMQEPVFFNMTIRENLLIVKAQATEEELQNCCKKASIYEFIETLPDKFDTVIGENGMKLSGGQKQRLSIARAFLQDNDIVIFDESTSALDGEKENEIINAIKHFSKDKTLILISHHISTIKNCDNVIVLKTK